MIHCSSLFLFSQLKSLMKVFSFIGPLSGRTLLLLCFRFWRGGMMKSYPPRPLKQIYCFFKDSLWTSLYRNWIHCLICFVFFVFILKLSKFRYRRSNFSSLALAALEHEGVNYRYYRFMIATKRPRIVKVWLSY